MSYVSLGRNRTSTRCLSDSRSGSSFDATCGGRYRLSEASSEEAQEAGSDEDRICCLAFPEAPPRALRRFPIRAVTVRSLPRSGLVQDYFRAPSSIWSGVCTVKAVILQTRLSKVRAIVARRCARISMEKIVGIGLNDIPRRGKVGKLQSPQNKN